MRTVLVMLEFPRRYHFETIGWNRVGGRPRQSLLLVSTNKRLQSLRCRQTRAVSAWGVARRRTQDLAALGNQYDLGFRSVDLDELAGPIDKGDAIRCLSAQLRKILIEIGRAHV